MGDRLTVFGGLGLEFVSAKAKFTSIPSTPATEEERSTAKSFGLSGRIGLTMKLGERVSIAGRFGNSLALASSKAATGNAKSSALTNSFDAAWGLAFSFGGK